MMTLMALSQKTHVINLFFKVFPFFNTAVVPHRIRSLLEDGVHSGKRLLTLQPTKSAVKQCWKSCFVCRLYPRLYHLTGVRRTRRLRLDKLLSLFSLVMGIPVTAKWPLPFFTAAKKASSKSIEHAAPWKALKHFNLWVKAFSLSRHFKT